MFAVLATGQDGEFTATAPSVVQVGQQFQYTVQGSERGDVKLPAIDNFQLLGGPYSSFSSHSQWINGKMTQKTEVSYIFVFRAMAEGTFQIPGTTVKVGRKTYTTNVVDIVVNSGAGGQTVPGGAGQGGAGAGNQAGAEEGTGTGGSGDQPLFLRVIPSRRDVYVGEQFVSALKVYTRVNTQPGSAASDLPYEGFYKKNLDPDTNARQEDINGQPYVTQVIQRHILIPQKSGDLVIAPYESD